MSGNRSQQPPLDPSQYRDANELVRSILDDRPSTVTVSPSGELYRAVERFHRNIDRVISAANAANAASPTSMSSGSDRELRRRFNRDPEPPSENGRSASIFPPGLPPLRSLHRINMASSGGSSSRSSRYHRDRVLERHRSTLEARNNNSSFDEFNRSLDDANSHLRALLELTNSGMAPQPAISPPLQTSERSEDSRRVKRRKLDWERASSDSEGIHYGRYGQLEPGQLTMEIVSCDGGLHPYSDGTAENILKNDSSVYCTKGSRCNIVLRHQGASVFSLKELVIKAPGPDHYPVAYTSPVREGMVFVSMSRDELFTRTEQYQIQYAPSCPAHAGSMPAIYSIRHEEDGTRIRRAGYHSHIYDEDDEEHRTAQIPPEFNVSPPFHITTECSEDHSGDESNRHSGRLRDYRRTPNRIGVLPFESGDSDDGADAWGPSASDWSFEDMARFRNSSRGRGDADPGSMTLEEAREASQIALQEAVRAVGGELMPPLARFSIEKDKNKCTISFDPPVSGRFILLKMWSPHHDPGKNIDIQAVVAKGFAGTRYFPSVQLM